MKAVFIIYLYVTAIWLVCAEGVFDFEGMKQGFFTCDQIKNITILPYTNDRHDMLIPQLAYLVKSLLDTPCVMVWIYSTLRAQSILQQVDHYNHFLETDIQGMNEADENMIVEFLLDFSKMGVTNQQTLFIIDDSRDLC